MVVHELSDAECREVLSRTETARLACAHGEQPYVVPISITYDGESHSLFTFSALGKKVQWMRANPKVCVEIENVADRFNWTTIVIFGRYDEIDRSPDQRDLRSHTLQLLEKHARWWLPGAAKVTGEEPDHVLFYRIRIDSMTGRRAHGGSM